VKFISSVLSSVCYWNLINYSIDMDNFSAGPYKRHLDIRVPQLVDAFDKIVDSYQCDTTKKRKLRNIQNELATYKKYFRGPNMNEDVSRLYNDLIERVEIQYPKYKWGRKLPAKRTSPRSPMVDIQIGANLISTNVRDFSNEVSRDSNHAICVMSRFFKDAIGRAIRPRFAPITLENCSTRVQCGICSLYVEEMVVTRCGHRLCSPCLTNLDSDACPNCKAQLSLTLNEPHGIVCE